MADAPEQGWNQECDELATDAGFKSWGHWVDHLETHTKAGKKRSRRRKICGRRVRGSDGKTEKGTPCCLTAGAPSPKGEPTGHKGVGACGAHGGLTDFGVAHVNYVDGSSSKYRPHGSLGERFQNTEGGLSLDDDIRLTEAQIGILVENLPEDCPTPRQLISRITDLDAALRRLEGNRTEANFNRTIQMMGVLQVDLSGVAAYWAGIDRIGELQGVKRQLVDTELRRITKEHGPLNWNDFLVIIDGVKTVVWEIIEGLVPKEGKAEAMRLVRSIDSLPAPSGQLN